MTAFSPTYRHAFDQKLHVEVTLLPFDFKSSSNATKLQNKFQKLIKLHKIYMMNYIAIFTQKLRD